MEAHLMALVDAKKGTRTGKTHKKHFDPSQKSTMVLLKALAMIPNNLNVNKGVSHSLFMKKGEMTPDPQMH